MERRHISGCVPHSSSPTGREIIIMKLLRGVGLGVLKRVRGRGSRSTESGMSASLMHDDTQGWPAAAFVLQLSGLCFVAYSLKVTMQQLEQREERLRGGDNSSSGP